MKIATWNVNSIRAREERLLRWLEKETPDVLCLQELKVTDADFPLVTVESAGYRAATFGQRTYNGVAILSREDAVDVERGFADDVEDEQARYIEATVRGVRVACAYFPNGKSVGSDKYEYKLTWMDRLRAHLDRRGDASGDFVLCGDFNVAPDDADVANPERWAESVLCHADARAALERIGEWGLVDVFRRHHPEGGVYSWWDYRMLAFPKGDGLRIDHVFATESMAARCVEARVDRDERKGKKPSDHAPVVATFD